MNRLDWWRDSIRGILPILLFVFTKCVVRVILDSVNNWILNVWPVGSDSLVEALVRRVTMLKWTIVWRLLCSWGFLLQRE